MNKERAEKLLKRAEEKGNEKEIEFFSALVSELTQEKQMVCFTVTKKEKGKKKK